MTMWTTTRRREIFPPGSDPSRTYRKTEVTRCLAVGCCERPSITSRASPLGQGHSGSFREAAAAAESAISRRSARETGEVQLGEGALLEEQTQRKKPNGLVPPAVP